MDLCATVIKDCSHIYSYTKKKIIPATFLVRYIAEFITKEQ